MIRMLLKKYKKLLTKIMVISLISSIIISGAVYVYFSHTRTYTASVSFRFLNSNAKDGYANDGTPLNFEEIRGAEILGKALEKYGPTESGLTADELAASLTVEEVIPKEEQDKIDSALKNGKEYEYNPVEFKATLTTGEVETARLLQCIADSYYEYYEENHVVKFKLTPVADIEAYDYIEIADELRTVMLSDKDFLTTANASDPDFRCSMNGYLFSDIMAEYDYLYNNDLPRLYAMILSGHAAKNPSLLLDKLNKRVIQNDYASRDTKASTDIVETLILSYSEKNKAQEIGTGDYSNLIDENHQNIMDYVYENDTSPTATYDNLFKRYYSELDIVSVNNVDNEYYKYLISVFENAVPLSEGTKRDAIESQIAYIYEKALRLHELSVEAKEEYDAVLAAKVLKQLNTPYAVASGHVKLYTALAFVAVNMMVMIAAPILMIFKKRLEDYIGANVDFSDMLPKKEDEGTENKTKTADMLNRNAEAAADEQDAETSEGSQKTEQQMENENTNNGWNAKWKF